MNKKILISILVILANVGIDQISKQWAQSTLKGKPSTSYFNDMFKIIYAENDGAFLSLGSDLPDNVRFWVLGMIPVVILVIFLLYTWFSREVDFWSGMAFSFIIGGGLSNIIDRFLYGSVVDFMNMGIGNLRTGIFNIADVSIIVGIILYIIINLKTLQKATTTAETEKPA